jgi:glucokinase
VGSRKFIGIDIGGTSIKAALIGDAARIERCVAVPTPATEDAARLADQLSALVDELQGRAGQRIDAVGVGVPGIVDEKRGSTRAAVNLRIPADAPLRELLQDALGVPVFLGHDMRMFTLAETRLGAGRGLRDLIAASIGSGIGIGIVIGGEIYTRSTGDWGHVTIDYQGAPCGCGGRGCLETMASGPAIARAARQRARAEATSLGSSAEIARVTAEDVFRAAREGDAMCKDVVRNAAEALGAGIATLFALLNPQALIIGGGVAESWDVLFPLLCESLSTRAPLFPDAASRVIRAALGQNAGCIGAALFAEEKLGGSTGVREA